MHIDLAFTHAETGGSDVENAGENREMTVLLMSNGKRVRA